jgi:hypothetical protein
VFPLSAFSQQLSLSLSLSHRHVLSCFLFTISRIAISIVAISQLLFLLAHLPQLPSLLPSHGCPNSLFDRHTRLGRTCGSISINPQTRRCGLPGYATFPKDLRSARIHSHHLDPPYPSCLPSPINISNVFPPPWTPPQSTHNLPTSSTTSRH